MPLIDALISQDALEFLRISSKAQAEDQANLQRAQELTGQVSQIYNTVADSAALVSLTRNMADMKAQQATAAAANAAGINPNLGIDSMVDSISILNKKGSEHAKAVEDVISKRNLKISDNPLAWISAQFEIPGAQAKVRNAADQYNAELVKLSATNNAIGQVAKVQDLIKESTTAASANALANIAAGEAKINSIRADIEGLKYNSAAIHAGVTGPKERLAALYDLNSAEQRSESFALEAKRFKLAEEQFDWHKEEKKLTDQAKLDARSIDEVLANKINIGRGVMGLPPAEGIEIKSMLQAFKSGGSKDLQRFYEIGERSIVLGHPVIGATPSEALKNLEDLPNTVAPIRLEARSIIQQARKAILTSPLTDKKDIRAVDEATDKLVHDQIGTQLLSITPGSHNIFDVGDITQFLPNKNGAGIGDLNALPFSQKILIPAIAAEQSLSDPKIILGLASKAMQEGVITSTQAANDISQIYRKANLINQSALNLKGLGIQVPADGMLYNARVGTFGGTIDMTSPQKIGEYLAKDLAERIFRQRPFNEGGTGFRGQGEK